MNRKYRKTIIAGNWKMNQLASTIKPFMEELKANMPKTKTCDVVLCAPAVMVPALIRAGKDCKVAAGAQDVSKFEKGAYTGEISAAQLADIGAKYCIVGHSERRQYHGEDDMLVNAKAKALLAKGIAPIICVGESLEQREMDLTMEYVAYSLRGHPCRDPQDLRRPSRPCCQHSLRRQHERQECGRAACPARHRRRPHRRRFPEAR